MSRPSLADKILPKYFRDELDRILVHNNQKNHSIHKSIPSESSKKTRLERRNSLRLIFAELWQLGYKLKSPTALKPKHLHALCAHWQEKSLGIKTIHGLFSNIRAFCRWIDKEGMLEDISVYFGGRENLVRKTAATPPRQNSCRPDRIDKLGAMMEEEIGSIRTSIQGQSGGEVVAAGERDVGRCGA